MARRPKPTENKVSVGKDGIIRVVYHGSQTASTLQDMTTRQLAIMQRLIDSDKPVMLLVDIRDLGEFSLSAKLVDMHARTILPFWKMALVTSGARPESEIISRKLTSMSGRRKEIRYFQREDDAVGWLSFMR